MSTPHHPPLAVRRALRKLGGDVRDARKRRGLTAEIVAERAFTIDNANVQLRTVYEIVGGSKTHERCRNNLDPLNGEIELLVRKVWPSHRPVLRQLGLA